MKMSEPVLTVKKLTLSYAFGREGLFRTKYVRAVRDVSLTVKRGEITSLVGESGSGKTTLGKGTLRLLKPTEGEIFWENDNVTNMKDSKLRRLRRYYQIIQQDPYSSLDPTYKVYDIIAEGIRLHKLATSRQDEQDMIYRMLSVVRLTPPEEFAVKRPYELSGGQRQRVAIARALVLKPKYIVADEPVSMLDASTRGQIVDFILKARENDGTSILFITHDISLASYISDTINVMYLGKVVESGKPEDIVNRPMHPYTQALIEAVPIPDPEVGIKDPRIKGDMDTLLNIPTGCVFRNRCPYAFAACEQEPTLRRVEGNHYVACHLIR
ncbi:ABC transporter ATP-binding protein [Sulfolobales archaeon HS-7]|nr:ABC transporter ATP-binding protein [Sulfolobales archaeon HS-7]